MNERKRVFLLIVIMGVACLAATGAAIVVLYRTAFEEQRDILVAIAKNHARLIEEAAQSEGTEPSDISIKENKILQRIVHAHKHFEGIGHTGEFTLAKREGDNMIFLFDHRYKEVGLSPIPMKSNLAEPMRAALEGRSGSMVGLDYRGVKVLAAHEPIAGLNWGIVAKVDLAELRVPFARAGAVAIAITTVLVLAGALLFGRVTDPMIARLRDNAEHLKELVDSLKRSEEDLRRARDELEVRVQERTAELARINDRLSTEIKVRTRAEERLKALWDIAAMVNASVEELCEHILQGTLRMTQSRYAFYGFLSPDEKVMSIYAWSNEALQDCRTLDRPLLYPINKAGIWAEAVRQRRVIVVNDYEADNPAKKGLPEGHIPLSRILAVPVFSRGQIVAVVVAANKDTDYDSDDIRQLESYAVGVQQIIDQRKMEQALRESEQQCRLLSRQVLGAQEAERKRLAREIHDSVGQSLAALKYRAEGILRMRAGEEGARTREMQSFVQMIREVMEEVRRIQNDLRPVHLDIMGVLDSVADFCEKFKSTYQGIAVDMEFGLREEDVPEYLKVPIFRIFQEAMHNVAKHSRAGRVRVGIGLSDGKIQLTVQDDGIGFDVHRADSKKGREAGLGLFSMRERAEINGGVFNCRSAPGEGTRISVTWPRVGGTET